jgi:tetratricopeptide (TPR) repeat protein
VAEGRLEDAWQYVKEQVELFPNAVSYALAAVVCYQRARTSEGATRASLFETQGDYFTLARKEFARLPGAHQQHHEIRAALGLGYGMEVLRLSHSETKEAALARCDEAIAFDPASPSPRAIKGFLLWPGDDGVACLSKAAELGDKSSMTYYYLANAAMTRGDYRGCLDHARQAIQLGTTRDQEVKALLYQWAAISLAKMGGPQAEVERLFSEAIATAPDNARAKESYREYRAKLLPEPPPIALRDPANAIQIPVFAGHQMAIVA